jgi:hypothetical protein
VLKDKSIFMNYTAQLLNKRVAARASFSSSTDARQEFDYEKFALIMPFIAGKPKPSN